MNKTDLVAAVAAKAEISKKDAEAAVAAVVAVKVIGSKRNADAEADFDGDDLDLVDDPVDIDESTDVE